ncbi:MAG: hypothetical protein N4A35_05570 [Flavobacteriales bacterium]|jgi:hypothetical protein|nr:hypothetical protein [Flavobacteriales bacterium]
MLENELNKLKNIKKVAPSPFVLTRIEGKLGNEAFQKVSLKQLIPLSIGFCFLLALNMYTISVNSSNQSTKRTTELSETFVGESSNHLYYE